MPQEMSPDAARAFNERLDRAIDNAQGALRPLFDSGVHNGQKLQDVHVAMARDPNRTPQRSRQAPQQPAKPPLP